MADIPHTVKFNCWFADELIFAAHHSTLFFYDAPTEKLVSQVKVRQSPPGALVNMLGPHVSVSLSTNWQAPGWCSGPVVAYLVDPLFHGSVGNSAVSCG